MTTVYYVCCCHHRHRHRRAATSHAAVAVAAADHKTAADPVVFGALAQPLDSAIDQAPLARFVLDL